MIRSRDHFWRELVRFEREVEHVREVVAARLGVHHLGRDADHDVMARRVDDLGAQVEQRADFHRFAEHDVVDVGQPGEALAVEH